MTAVGIYIRTLREKQGITRAWLAEQVDTTDTSLYRIEKGDQQPGLDLMIGIVQALRGSFEDVRALLRGDDQEHGGVELAEQRLSRVQVARIDAAIDEMGPDEAERLADQLMNDPAFRESIVRAVAGPRGGRKRE